MFVGSTAAGPSIHARTQVTASMNGLDVCTSIFTNDAHVMHWRCIRGYLLPKAVSFPLHITHQGLGQLMHVSLFLAFWKDIKAPHPIHLFQHYLITTTTTTMKQQIFGTLAFFYISAASAMPFLAARQDTTENNNHDDVSALVGTCKFFFLLDPLDDDLTCWM